MWILQQLNRLQKFFKTNPAITVVVGVGMIFLIATSIASVGIRAVPNSPDEMAARATISAWQERNSLSVPIVSVPALEYEFAPRSMSIVDGQYVPAIFYGLPVIYGSIAKVFGFASIWVLTPLAVFVAGLAFFGLVRLAWGERIAMISGMLYFLHPVLWYYSTRGLYPNALFASLVLIGLYVLFKRPWGSATIMRSVVNDVVAYACIVAALLVRTAEAPWVAALLVLSWLLVKGWQRGVLTITWLVLIAVSLFTAITLAPQFIQTFWSGGYVLGEFSMSQLLFPFGIHPRVILDVFWRYGITLLGFISVVSLLGLLAALVQLVRKKAWFSSATGKYTLLGIFTLWYPVVVYGSWVIQDNPTPWFTTVGSSYLRYGIPLLIFLLPFAAYGLAKLFDHLRTKDPRYAGGVWIAFFVLWIIQSGAIFYGGSDGYRQLSDNIAYAASVKQEMVELVGPGTPIIVDRWDKVFWPDLTVARGLFDPSMAAAIKQIVVDHRDAFGEHGIPIFYFGRSLSEEQYDVLTDDYNLDLVEFASFDDHILYAFP